MLCSSPTSQDGLPLEQALIEKTGCQGAFPNSCNVHRISWSLQNSIGFFARQTRTILDTTGQITAIPPPTSTESSDGGFTHFPKEIHWRPGVVNLSLCSLEVTLMFPLLLMADFWFGYACHQVGSGFLQEKNISRMRTFHRSKYQLFVFSQKRSNFSEVVDSGNVTVAGDGS